MLRHALGNGAGCCYLQPPADAVAPQEGTGETRKPAVARLAANAGRCGALRGPSVHQPLAYTENRAALRAFGDFQTLFRCEARNLQFGAKRSLRDAERNRAVEVSAASLKKVVFFHVQHNVQIASRPAVRSRLTLTLDPETRAGVDAGRNAELNCPLAVYAALATALEEGWIWISRN